MAPSSVGVSVLRTLLVTLGALHLATPFNVDTTNFVLHRGERDSMFGFSVAQHLDRGQSWLLVGAPTARTSQPGVNRGGSVFRCEISRDDSCQEIPFDRKGNNIDPTGAQIDNKSGQWFGATVKSSGINGIVLVCAPRYVYYSASKQRREPVGTCYVARNATSAFDEYSPCRTDQWGYHRQGSCQAGLGADISKDGKRLFIGAPGSFYWQGQMYSISGERPQLLPPTRSAILASAGTAFSQSLYSRPDLKATREGKAEDDDSYLGYSVVVGDFTGEGRQGCAVGMPKGAELLGKVLLYTWDLVNVFNVTGTQLGAYFGYSVCASDVDGDGFQDLVVGAPLYTELDNNEGKYETGRVYIFYQGQEQNKFKRVDVRDGEKSKSRFGLALTGLGDINRDGYEDFAVGAPYDGPVEHGAVYIYHGSAEGVREKFSQVIFAEEIAPNIATFGFSVSGGYDMDENQYSDLLVGAYESSIAIHFPSRPVVNMDAKVSFSSEVKQIALDDLKCRLRDGIKVACVDVTACMEYSGIGVERRLDFDFQLILDAKKPKSPRMFFMNEEGKNTINQTVRLNNKSLVCRSLQGYIKPNIRDKLTPIEAELRYSLLKSPTSNNQLQRRAQRSLEPVLDMNSVQVQRDAINIQKNCGPDNVCIPDLKLETSTNVDHYLLGSERRLEINVEVYNSGEDSFESMYYLTIPPGLNYINIERSGADSSVPVQCSAPSSTTNNTLRCDIGNPLPSRKLVKFKVLLQPYWAQGLPSRYDFKMVANSTNPEEDFSAKNNIQEIKIPIKVDTDLHIEGSSFPPQLFYNTSAYLSKDFTHESQIGPLVEHVYAIRNKGPSDILEAEAYFMWPSRTLDGAPLFYLLEQPETSGPIKCEHEPTDVNPLRVRLDKRNSSHLPTDDDETGHGGRLGVSMLENEETTGYGRRGGGSSSHHHRQQSSRTETHSSGGVTRTSSHHTTSWSTEWTSSEEELQNLDDQRLRRTRRQKDLSGESYEDYQYKDDTKELEDATKCGPTQCTRFKCIVGPFSKDKEVWVAFRGRVYAETLKAVSHTNLKISSMVASRITKLPYINQPEYMAVKKLEVMMDLISTDTPLHPSDHVPWWVVVLSACIGAAILILLVFLLWKCGFFKRNRPQNTAEKEPLNRNGHYQPGDEHL